MKNLAKSAGVLVLVLGAMCVTSCSEKDDLTPGVKAVETTKVDFTVGAEAGNSTMSKVVDRNAAPLYVDNVTINATCNGYGLPYVATDLFTFAPNVTGTQVASGFSLSNVGLGINTFTASSESANANKHLSLSNVITPTGSSVLDVLKAHTPYIPTTSTPVQATIVKGINAPISLVMNTNHGRIIAKFAQESQADNYYTTVEATVGNVVLPATAIINANTISPAPLAFEWSNENAIDGASVIFTIRVYEKATTPGGQGALLNTFTKAVSVKKATTRLYTFTVKNTDVMTDLVEGGISLVFPTIAEEVINQ